MNTTVAIDPGADSGWAIFKFGKLKACGLTKGSAPVGGVAFAEKHPDTPVEAIIERPRIYPGAGQKARPEDIITLALRAGEWGGVLREAGAQVQYVEPAVWKGGSISKGVSHARLWAKLSAGEQAVVAHACKGMAEGKRHNVLDAVGIGLFGVGR